MLCDFHTHTFLSDGELSPMELIRRAAVSGYDVIGITDHAGAGNLEFLTRMVRPECEAARRNWDIQAFCGVELTHLPPAEIAGCAHQARELGAQLVVVHGETPVEPVPQGTNRAAALCPDVDVLAHPGLIDGETARIAAERELFVEITCRAGHSLANGHVAAMSRRYGFRVVINTDTHSPQNLMTPGHAWKVARCAGLTEEEADAAININAQALFTRIKARP